MYRCVPPIVASRLAQLFLFSLSVCLTLLALELPACALDPNRELNQYCLDSWSYRNGLPPRTIAAITQTTDDYLWLTSEQGVIRFDGNSFQMFDKDNTPGLPSEYTWALEPDPKGGLWVGTAGQSFGQLKDERFIAFPRTIFYDTFVRDFCYARDGSLWVGGHDLARIRFQDQRAIPDVRVFSAKTTGFDFGTVNGVMEDSKGIIWIAAGSGLYSVVGDRLARYGDMILVGPICEDREGNLWVRDGINPRIRRLNNGRWTVYTKRDGLSSPDVRCLYCDSHGAVWLGTSQGIDRFYAGRFSTLKITGDLKEAVTAIFEDREGNLWVATGTTLHRLSDAKLIPFVLRRPAGTEEASAGPQCYTADDQRFWYAFDSQSGLWCQIGSTLTRLTDRDGWPVGTVVSLAAAPDGGFWGTVRISSFGGPPQSLLVRYRNGKVTTFPLGTEEATCVCVDKEGPWLARTLGEQWYFERWRNGRRESFGPSCRLQEVKVASPDSQGRLWLLSDGGLYCIDQHHATPYHLDRNGTELFVYSLFVDARDDCWLATDLGLARLRNGSTTYFDRASGLPDDKIAQILGDGKGNLWIGCNRGVFSVRQDDFEALDNRKIRSIPYRFFDASDGLRRFPNGQPLVTFDGRFWFHTGEDYVIVDPNHIPTNLLPPQVRVVNAILDKCALSLVGGSNAPPGSGDLEIRYTALSYIAPERVLFKYKLEGYDQDWVDAGTRRAAYYTKLPPGNYRFRVIACNNDGVWNEAGAAILFTLQPNWYQTPWFYGVCVIGFVASTAFIFSFRARQLRRHNEELEKIVQKRTAELALSHAQLEARTAELFRSHTRLQIQAQELERSNAALSDFASIASHDLKEPLRKIQTFGNMLQRRSVLVLDESSKGYLDRMITASHRMQSLIEGLLSYSRVTSKPSVLESVELTTVLQGVLSDLETRIEETEGQVLIEDTLPCLMADPLQMRQLLQNLIGNALKFHKPELPPLIRIGTTWDTEGWYTITIRDNGIGFDPAFSERIFGIFERLEGRGLGRQYEGSGVGLAICRKIVERHGGMISASSQIGEGSIFTVRLPAAS